MKQEELQDLYLLLNADMSDLVNKEEKSWWDTQRIKEIEGVLTLCKLYAKEHYLILKEPEDCFED